MLMFDLPVTVTRRVSRSGLVRFETLDPRIMLSVGLLDPNFGSGGLVSTDFGFDDAGYAIATDSAGRIIVAGTVWSESGESDFGVARYLSDGSLDTSFGTDGLVVMGFGPSTTFDDLRAMTLDSSGRIVLAGYSFQTTSNDFLVARLNADGSMDTSFGGGDGWTASDFSTNDQAFAMALQGDGKILLAGLVNNDTAMARYNTDGSLDASFGTGGLVRVAMSTSFDQASSIAVQSDGRIVLVGYAQFSGNFDFALSRYMPNGTLDASFDGDGRLTIHLGTNSDLAMSVLVTPDGKILAGGRSNGNAAVLRLNADGTRDMSFGASGLVLFDLGGSQDVINSMLVTGDGQYLLAGTAGTNGGRNFAIVRMNGNGALDTSFGIGGITRADFGGDTDEGRAIALHGAQHVLVAGVVITDPEAFYPDSFGMARFTLSEEIPNVPPTANAGGPYSVNEGSMVELSGAGSDDPDGTIVSWEWDFDYDGSTFEANGIGTTVMFSAANLDGPMMRTVALRVTDDMGATHVITTTVEVLNVAPMLSTSGPTRGVTFQSLGFSASASDPGAGDALAMTWDFGDGTVVTGTPGSMEHAYRSTGSYDVTVTVMDDDGGSSSSTFTVVVSRVLFENGSLYVGGTARRDAIHLNRKGSKLQVQLNGRRHGTFNVTGSIVAYGGDGNDFITVHENYRGSVHFYGGRGNDVLRGGRGNDMLDGGAGNDSLDGRKGNDRLLGRAGRDAIFGGDGNDTLDGGAGRDYLKDMRGTNVFISDASDTVVQPKPKKAKKSR